jgi:hypothetical protein
LPRRISKRACIWSTRRGVSSSVAGDVVFYATHACCLRISPGSAWACGACSKPRGCSDRSSAQCLPNERADCRRAWHMKTPLSVEHAVRRCRGVQPDPEACQFRKHTTVLGGVA